MIFVVTGVFAQKNVINNVTENNSFTVSLLDTSLFCSLSLVKKENRFYLGFSKLNQSREVEGTPAVLGMINKVAHLLKVENV